MHHHFLQGSEFIAKLIKSWENLYASTSNKSVLVQLLVLLGREERTLREAEINKSRRSFKLRRCLRGIERHSKEFWRRPCHCGADEQLVSTPRLASSRLALPPGGRRWGTDHLPATGDRPTEPSGLPLIFGNSCNISQFPSLTCRPQSRFPSRGPPLLSVAHHPPTKVH